VGPNTLNKLGAELVATGEDESEDLPAAARLVLARPAGDESGRPSSASLCPDEGLPPHEKRILGLFKADQATHIDEIVEQLETEMSPSEIFAALFELNLAGKVRQMPRKNFVRGIVNPYLSCFGNVRVGSYTSNVSS
jgi:DNA processing protein